MEKITFEKIIEANKSIKPMAIERFDKKSGKTIKKDYAEVNQRIKAFRMVYPDGFIMTDIISHEGGIIVMQAKAGYYADNGDAFIIGTGTAFENQKNGLINGTSYIENCETSAIGRALGMCGFGIDTSIASYEEVNNAMAQQEAPSASKKPVFTCAACGNTFTDAVTAEKSMQRWKKYICIDCIRKKQAETRQKALEKARKEAEALKAKEQAEQIANTSQGNEQQAEEPEQIPLPFEF